MPDVLEVRWHGRGGQGAKTAAVLFADIAISTGRFVQAFPQYGPERMGAPVVAYNRVSSTPIRLHTPIERPDYVLILDPKFIGKRNLTAGLSPRGTVMVNTPRRPAEMRQALNLPGATTVCCLDASRIAEDTIGRNIPNVPMVAALVKILQLVTLEDLKDFVREQLEKKFRGQPDLVKGNLEAVDRAYREVERG